MPRHLILYSALSYVQQWYRTDREFMSALSGGEGHRIAVGDIRRLATKYMVARNFKSSALAADELARRWRAITRHVEAVRDGMYSTQDQRVNDLALRLGQVFPAAKGKSSPVLLSAASKFLWFAGLRDVRIYDKRAVSALAVLQKERALSEGRSWQRVAASYQGFASVWKEECDAHSSDICAAAKAVAGVLDWSIIPAGSNRVAAMRVAKEQWFRDRVFDKYLWTLGEGKKAGLDTFM